MKEVEYPQYPPMHPKETCCEKHLREYRERLVDKIHHLCENLPELEMKLRTTIYS